MMDDTNLRKTARNILRSLLRPSLHERVLLPEIVDFKGQDEVGAKLVVFAPHPDDEVIGCGGTIFRHHLAGSQVTIVYVTSGSQDSQRGEFTSLRAEESAKAAATLGVDNRIFLGFYDRQVKASNKAKDAVCDVLLRLEPAMIYLPSSYERHPDHFETYRIVKAASKAAGRRIRAFCYEVWTPIPYPDVSVDITDAIEKKVQALRCYASQFLQRPDALEAFISLSRYRGYSLSTGGYAECFVKETFG